MSVSRALFTDSQARVFGWVFGQPERSFHLSELRRLTGLGSASVQRELNRLAQAGLVLSERCGNQRRFQANRNSPVFTELAALTRKTLGAEPALREAVLSLGSRLKAAWIYGSIAKGCDTAASDIDVMLVGEKMSMADVLACLMPVEAQLGRKINPTCYTPAEFARRRADPDSFVSKVLAQPTLRLIGNEIEPISAR